MLTASGYQCCDDERCYIPCTGSGAAVISDDRIRNSIDWMNFFMVDSEGVARFQVRRAEPHDADAIAEIHMTSRRVAMPWLPVLHSDDETRDWIATIVLPNQEVWVAESNGQVAGYVTVDGTELNDLYIRPTMQGKGVGSALLAKAKELSPGELLLWTFQRNEKARRFYERRAFTAIEFTDGSGNEEREPDVRYQWFRPQ